VCTDYLWTWRKEEKEEKEARKAAREQKKKEKEETARKKAELTEKRKVETTKRKEEAAKKKEEAAKKKQEAAKRKEEAAKKKGKTARKKAEQESRSHQRCNNVAVSNVDEEEDDDDVDEDNGDDDDGLARPSRSAARVNKNDVMENNNWPMLCVVRMFEEDQYEETGFLWVKCAHQRWVHEDCYSEVLTDKHGRELICPYCVL